MVWLVVLLAAAVMIIAANLPAILEWMADR